MKRTPAQPVKRGPREKKEGRVNVRIPADRESWLKRCAGARHVTVGVILREIIDSAFEKRHAK